MKILFSNVGRDKWSGDTVCPPNATPDDIAGIAARAASRHLLSHNIETDYDPEANEGTIYAGFRAVGTFRVEMAAQQARQGGLARTYVRGASKEVLHDAPAD